MKNTRYKDVKVKIGNLWNVPKGHGYIRTPQFTTLFVHIYFYMKHQADSNLIGSSQSKPNINLKKHVRHIFKTNFITNNFLT